MQSLAIFDIIILSITLILGLKGLMKGLVKEVFGIIGIVGSVFVASRTSGEVGNLLAPILGLESSNTISLIGFVASLIGFWLVIYVIGTIVSKMFAAAGLGLFDRLFGFIFGAGKIFLIFAIIAHALYQINSFKKTLDEKTQNSIVMPYLLSTGAFIMKLDTLNIQSDEQKEDTNQQENQSQSATDEVLKSVGNGIKTLKDTTDEITSNVKQKVEEEIINKVEDQIDNAKNISSEEMEQVKKQLEEKLQSTNTEEKTN
ncbi:MAG: CvpA family protein [Sulfurovum sp.]